MRIALSTSVIQRGQTGIAQYIFALVKKLCDHTSQHHFTLFVLENDLPLFEFARSKMELISVPEQFRPPVKNIVWHQTHLPRFIRQHKIDVLHVPSYRRLLWPQPCALVATIHDLAPFHVAEKYDWKRMIYGRVVVKQLVQRQHEIIAISQNTAKDIQRFFKVPSGKISVIHNGLEHERFFPGANDVSKQVLAQKHGIHSPFFLYISRLEHPAKNHVRLIEAFNRFKTETISDWHLVFGGSDWHGAEVIHQTIAQSPFRQDIRSLGFVADAELPDLYRAADCFIYPSLFEGFGMPTIEAMACGSPVISSARGSLGEVVGNAALITDPENISDMVAQMKRLCGDAELRKTLLEAGILRARQFDWNRTAETTLAVYHRALGHGNAAIANDARNTTAHEPPRMIPGSAIDTRR